MSRARLYNAARLTMQRAAQPDEAAIGDISKLLRAGSALERLTPFVYRELTGGGTGNGF